MNKLFSYGLNCKDNTQPMQLLDLYQIADMIKNNKSPLAEETKLLRTVYQYSKERYTTMKTRLPYISCSTFTPQHRKYEHFTHANGWILDIDLQEPMAANLKSLILADDRVAIQYTSPNGYGMKLIFVFEQPYTDKVNYSAAYKTFTQEFGLKYGILDKMDLKNCDVSRISFLCHDAGICFNPLASYVDPSNYIFNPHALTEIVTAEKISKPTTDIAPDVYKNILQKLGTKPKPVQSRPFVPTEIIKTLEPLSVILAENGIEVTKQEEIQHGMRITATMGSHQGEVIIYHGRKGFSVVSSARKGMHHDLSEIMRQLSDHFLWTYILS